MNYTHSKFDEILKKANKYIDHISKKRQEELSEQLKHGAGNLSTNDELAMYLVKYGAIHRAKLILALEHLPRKIWAEERISIVHLITLSIFSLMLSIWKVSIILMLSNC